MLKTTSKLAGLIVFPDQLLQCLIQMLRIHRFRQVSVHTHLQGTLNIFVKDVGGEGDDIWQMVGISYWNEQDGHRLAGHIKEAYEMPGGKERYWDQVALEYFVKDYKVEVRECSFEDIVEIDNYSELKKLDSIYCTD